MRYTEKINKQENSVQVTLGEHWPIKPHTPPRSPPTQEAEVEEKTFKQSKRTRISSPSDLPSWTSQTVTNSIFTPEKLTYPITRNGSKSVGVKS